MLLSECTLPHQEFEYRGASTEQLAVEVIVISQIVSQSLLFHRAD
jgi:hypothetical protein